MSARTSWVIEECGCEDGLELEKLQRLALDPLAEELLAVMRDLLDWGVLVRENGMISVNLERELADD